MPIAIKNRGAGVLGSHLSSAEFYSEIGGDKTPIVDLPSPKSEIQLDIRVHKTPYQKKPAILHPSVYANDPSLDRVN